MQPHSLLCVRNTISAQGEKVSKSPGAEGCLPVHTGSQVFFCRFTPVHIFIPAGSHRFTTTRKPLGSKGVLCANPARGHPKTMFWGQKGGIFSKFSAPSVHRKTIGTVDPPPYGDPPHMYTSQPWPTPSHYCTKDSGLPPHMETPPHMYTSCPACLPGWSTYGGGGSTVCGHPHMPPMHGEREWQHACTGHRH